MIIAYRIAHDEEIQFLEGFLNRFPIPPAEQGEQQLTPEQWLHEKGRKFFQYAYEQGARQAAHDAAVVLQSIIKVGTGTS